MGIERGKGLLGSITMQAPKENPSSGAESKVVMGAAKKAVENSKFSQLAKNFAKQMEDGIGKKIKDRFEKETNPLDQRVSLAVQKLLGVDTSALDSKFQLEQVVEDLGAILSDENPASFRARQARAVLYAITDEHKWLEPRAALALRSVSGGSTGSAFVDNINHIYTRPRDPLVGPVLNGYLKKYQNFLKFELASSGGHNPDRIREYIEEMKDVGYKRKIPSAKVAEAIKRLRALENEVQDKISQAEGIKRIKEHEGEGGLIIWKPEWAKLYGHTPDKKILRVRTGVFTQAELDEIANGGEEGILNFIYKFLEKNTTVGGKGFRPDLNISQAWDQFKDVTSWLWGEKNVSRVLDYQEFFELYEDVDGVLKAVLTRSKGDKPEESFKLLRFISGKHYEKLRGMELIEKAKPAFTESILSAISDDSAEYHETLRWLKEEIPHEGRQMTRAKVWEAIFSKQEDKDELGKAKIPVQLNDAERELLKSIEEKLDRVGMGILLRDKHMLFNLEAHDDMKNAFNEYQKNKARLAGTNGATVTPAERADIINKQADLKIKMDFNWKDRITLDKLATFNPDDPDAQQLLESVYRMSPVKIRAHTRVIQALRAEGKTDDQIRKMAPQIRMGLWAAEIMSIGKGEAMEKGARLGKAPGFDVRYTLGLRGSRYATLNKSWKYHMDRGFSEAYQRVFNDDLFADDFTMGGKAGDVMRDLYYTHAYKIFGYDKVEEQIERNDEWKKRMKKADDEQIPRWVIYAQYLQEVLGVPYTEVIRPNTLITGLHSVGTRWRDEEVVVDAIRDKFNLLRQNGKLRPDASFDYQALGIRLAIAQTDIERRQIFETIIQRKTSALFSLVTGNEVEEKILVGTGIGRGTKEWRQFEDSLAIIEMKLAQDENFCWNKFDLTNSAEFRPQMQLALKAVDPTLSDAEVGRRADAYFTIMTNMNNFMHQTTASGCQRIDDWVKHKWRNVYMVESTSFNWKDTNSAFLDLYHVDRRMNDFNGMAQAGALKRDLLTNSDFFSPHEGKEADMLVQLKKLRGAVEGYAGTNEGEMAQTPILRAIIDYNRDLASQGILGWVPGGATLFKNLNMAVSPEFRRFCTDWKLTDKPLNYWPRSLRGLVSIAGDFSGAEANRWDEFFIAKLLESAERNHQYTNIPELLEHMKHDYHTGVKRRLFVGLPRKFGYATVVATIGFAATTHVEDEKKQH